MKSLAKVQRIITQGNKELVWMIDEKNPQIYTREDVARKANETLMDALEEAKEAVQEIYDFKSGRQGK